MSELAILTVKDVAAELRCGPSYAYAVVREIGFRLGKTKGTWRVTREALNQWVSARSEQQWQANERAKGSTSEAASGGTGQTPSKAYRARPDRRRSKAPSSGSKSESGERRAQVTQPRTKRLSGTGSNAC